MYMAKNVVCWCSEAATVPMYRKTERLLVEILITEIPLDNKITYRFRRSYDECDSGFGKSMPCCVRCDLSRPLSRFSNSFCCRSSSNSAITTSFSLTHSASRLFDCLSSIMYSHAFARIPPFDWPSNDPEPLFDSEFRSGIILLSFIIQLFILSLLRRSTSLCVALLLSSRCQINTQF